MEKLVFDNGIREFQINGFGVLRCNPCDLNLYARFVEAGDKLVAAESEMVAKAKEAQGDGNSVLLINAEADREVKKILGWVFGPQNDFDQIFEGVNVMSPGSNGERVITNFVTAIAPVMAEGARQCAKRQIRDAVESAKREREQREAAK